MFDFGLKNSLLDRYCLRVPSSLQSTHLQLSYWQVSKFSTPPINVLRGWMWKESLRKLLQSEAQGLNMEIWQVHRHYPDEGCLSDLPWKGWAVLYHLCLIHLMAWPPGPLKCLINLCTPSPLAVGERYWRPLVLKWRILWETLLKVLLKSKKFVSTGFPWSIR